MLVSLKELGDYLREEDITGLRYYLTLDRLNRTQRIISMEFTWDGSEAEYQGSYLEDYSEEKGERSLYSRGTSRGGDYSPTSIITDPEKTVERIWEYGWFKKNVGDNPFLKALKDEYEEKQEQIFEDVKEKHDLLTGDESRNPLLTVKIQENGKAQFIEAYDAFRQGVEENVLKSWVETYGKVSKGRTHCAVCKDEKDVVGFGFPFPFRSFDKVGFAPYLKQELAWQQLPLCEDCAYSLLAAKSFLEENSFRYNISEGIRYYIIPEFPVEPPSESMVERILIGKKKDVDKYFVSADEYYTEFLVDEENPPMNMAFLFYTKPQQSQQLVEKYVEDVAPAWIKRLYKTAKEIEQLPLFREAMLKQVVGKKWSDHWQFRSLDNMLWRLLPDPEQLYDPKDEALELTKRILRQEPVDYDTVFNLLAMEARRRFVEQSKGADLRFYETPIAHSLDSFMFLLLLYHSDLIESNEYDPNVPIEVPKVGSNDTDIEKFLEDYNAAFDTPEKRAAFLEGVLVRKLLNVQFAQRGSSPFRSKLRGLRLDVDKLKSLLGEIENKLAAYDVGYVRLKTLLSQYMLDAESNKWNITRNELTYFFTLGMNLGKALE